MADNIFTEDELNAHAAAEERAQTPLEEEQQAAEEQSQEQQEEQPRGPDGKFLPKDATQDDDGKGGSAPPPPGFVPKGALDSERGKRKDEAEARKTAEAELKKLQEQLGAIAKMREQVNSRTTAPQPQPEGETNELEYLKNRLAQLEQGQTRIGQTLDNASLEQQEQATVHAALSHSEALFRQEHPDYDDAIRHVLNARERELSLYGLNPVEVRTALANEVADITKAALQQGKDPAEIGYQLATIRGYRAGEAAPSGQGKAGARIDAIDRARAATGKSVGQAAGSTPEQLTAEAILAMPPNEFEALYMTPEGRATIDAICGGA